MLVCIHDATPAWAPETRAMVDDLAPLVGRRLALGVVPDWHGAWPLPRHRGYCQWLQDSADELLLHGYHHRRERGSGPASWLAGRCDEMNGLDRAETRRTVQRGQRAFVDAFGAPARGFLAPGWQRGHLRRADDGDAALQYVLGFLSLDAGRRVPLATWSWDCGRWGWLGHVGHGLGSALHALGGRVPVLAIHPSDIARGFRPRILRLTRELLHAGYEPMTPTELLAC